MTLKKLCKKYFDYGNVSVSGLRGRGKDMLFANVINERGLPYVSLFDYNCQNENSKYYHLDFNDFNVNNNYKNFLNNDLQYYDFPFPDGTDIYISDCGIIFPSQYCNELNKQFSYFPTFFALSRHLGNCNVHFNTQYLGRCWDKLREQSDIYIVCRSCKVLFKKLVIQKIRVYEKYESALNNIAPFRKLKTPLFCKNKDIVNSQNELAYRSFLERNGSIKTHLLIYINRSNYDTRIFKNLLLGGKKNEKN